MRFEHVDARGTASAAAEKIAIAIAQGELAPGDRLPSERDLSEQLGVSRQTVRKAVKSLVEAGVVVVRSGQGAASGARVLSNQVPLDLLSGTYAQPNFNEIASVLEARRVFEPQVAVLAGFTMNDDDYDAVAEVIALQRDAPDLHGIRTLDIRFHLCIARATHNRVIGSLMQDLMRRLDIARHVVTMDSESEARATIDVHERTLEAIASRDTQRIYEVMDEHLAMMEDAWERVSERALPAYTRASEFRGRP